MKTTATYCRVSTKSQGKGVATLETQLENCLAYGQGKGYEVAYQFSEVCPSMSLERPELIKLRELVKSGHIDVVVVYALDRLSRIPSHLMVLTQELKKYGVELEAVDGNVDDLQIAQLTGYVHAFLSKVTAESIKERNKRGREAKAGQGHISSCSRRTHFAIISGRPVRATFDKQADWVRKIFKALANERLSIFAIILKLDADRVQQADA